MEGASKSIQANHSMKNPPSMDDCIKELIKSGGFNMGEIKEAQSLLKLIKETDNMEEEDKKNTGLFLMMLVEFANRFLEQYKCDDDPHN